MKKLTKLMMIHWYSYELETIEFAMVNFFTGATSAGKSTVIDALQLVLLADTRGDNFNKAANEKSKRDLKSYLYGQDGDDGDAGYRYMRTGPFTSYVGVEFLDTENNVPVSIVFAADCHSDGKIEWKWFILPRHALHSEEFVPAITNTPLSISELRDYLEEHVGKKNYQVYETNKSYREALAARLGSINSKYFLLLRKAVPFTPISDIEKFITESICEVSNRIDVDRMQSDILTYRRLENQAEAMRERIAGLEEIHAQALEYAASFDETRRLSYCIDADAKEAAQKEEKRLQGELERNVQALQEQQERVALLKKEIETLDDSIAQMEGEYHSSDLARKQRQLEEEIARASEKAGELDEAVEKAAARTREYGIRWSHLLGRLAETTLPMKPEYTAAVSGMADMTRETLPWFDFAGASALLEELHRRVMETKADCALALEKRTSEYESLKAQVENLKKGIKPYPEKVLAAKEKLSETFPESPVEIFSDLLEVRDPAWQDALEGFLGEKRFALLTSGISAGEARTILEENAYTDVLFVDTDRVPEPQGVLSGSLLETLESGSAEAMRYAAFLLGDVKRALTAEDLDACSRGVTRDGFVYDGYALSRMDPSRFENPFIGRGAMEQQLARKQRLLEEAAEDVRRLKKDRSLLDEAADTGTMSRYEADAYAEAASRIPELEETKKNLHSLRTELDGLDLTWLDELKKKIDAARSLRAGKDRESNTMVYLLAKTDTAVSDLKNVKLPESMQKILAASRQISENYDEAWVLEKGEPAYEEEKKKQAAHRGVSIADYCAPLLEAARERADGDKSRLVELRSAFNVRYQMGYDPSAKTNEAYDTELEGLRQNSLPSYEEQIRLSREKAYYQFRDDFIAKLKSNIETVRQQIRELNESLRAYSFGTDRYHFTIAPKAEYKAYYDMINDDMLMDTGDWNIASQIFNDKYHAQIEELFRLLIRDGEDSKNGEQYEKNIQKFTDYKTYLVFDLIVTDGEGREQRLSKTLLSKSGGETQIPFYISLLASFSQVCRVNSRKQNNTVRLIILDEAFSKIDTERIQECVRMLSQFGLQSIFSAPTNKLGEIARLVDRNIVAYRDGRHSFTRHFDPALLDEETMAAMVSEAEELE